MEAILLQRQGAQCKACVLYFSTLALAGNVVLLIWLGKQMLGQSEKVESKSELSGPDGGPISVDGRSGKDAKEFAAQLAKAQAELDAGK